MSAILTRQQVLVLAGASILGVYYCYFRMPLAVNAYGADPAVWPYLVDVLFTLPLLYFLLLRPAWRQMLTAWLGIAALGMLAGRWLNPQQEQAFGHYSLLLIATELALELALVLLLVRQCRQLLHQHSDVDAAMARTFTSKPMLFEARIWYYALFLRRGERLRFHGEQHFRYDQHHGNASNQLAWIMAILFEMPIAHVLLHLWLGNRWQTWAIDGLNLWGLLYLIAEYRATRWRPISLAQDSLIIRNGVLASDVSVPYAMIASVSPCDETGAPIRRQRGVLRYRQCGQLNVQITLRAGSQFPNLFGRERAVQRIFLSIDHAASLIEALRARLTTVMTPAAPAQSPPDRNVLPDASV